MSKTTEARSPTRESFVEFFGEEQASLLEQACETHLSADNLFTQTIGKLFGDNATSHADDNRGSDPFQYVILAVMGYECVTVPEYAEYHGITIDPLDFGNWVLSHADLDNFDGDHPGNLSLITRTLTRRLAEEEDRS